MFTGIISHQGTFNTLSRTAEGADIIIKSALFLENKNLKLGDSVAINGTCLTIVSIEQDTAKFNIASETLRKTTLGMLENNTTVNLETSLRIGDTIDGHFVYGHIDETGEVIKIEQESETWVFTFKHSAEISKFITKKGSISIDGTSLTVGECLNDKEKLEHSFSVYIIPHTYENTIFKNYKLGTKVNLESDILARYASRLLNLS